MMSTFADKTFGPCEICEKDRELSLTPSASGEWYAWVCWECLGEADEPNQDASDG